MSADVRYLTSGQAGRTSPARRVDTMSPVEDADARFSVLPPPVDTGPGTSIANINDRMTSIINGTLTGPNDITLVEDSFTKGVQQ